MILKFSIFNVKNLLLCLFISDSIYHVKGKGHDCNWFFEIRKVGCSNEQKYLKPYFDRGILTLPALLSQIYA